MTNHFIDLKNADVVMMIGSNAAENHPMLFKWITKAVEENGATLIVVDPRFTRSATRAHIYAPIRSGTDIAFVGGIINYVLQNNLYHDEYVRNYTDALFKVATTYDFENGVFSGLSGTSYDKTQWAFQTVDLGGGPVPATAADLDDPDCVFTHLRNFFSRYTPEVVASITGCPQDVFLQVCDAYASTGTPGRAGSICYAMGATQHTYGTQNIRAYGILQMLLGNMGVAGGGINALRGESNVQGSTDFGLLYHLLPGYLKSPRASNTSLGITDPVPPESYIGQWTPRSNDPKSANWWQNTPKYIVSLLKAWWGENATAANDFAYHHLPKIDGTVDYSHMSLFKAISDGTIHGLMLFGQNPAVAGPNSNIEREALANLEWLVAVDLWETETSAFWKAPGIDPSTITTEVFLLPAASSVEKQGSIINSGRWAQWRYKAVEPPGEAMDDLWIIDSLLKRLKDLYAGGGALPDPILNLTWNYGDPPDPNEVAKEINGRFLSGPTAGQQVAAFSALLSDGSTECGCWIYAGSYTQEGNKMARRDLTDETGTPIGLLPNWAWCWPVNRRIIYNRASCNPAGTPFDSQHPVIWWDSVAAAWKGDVPDGGWPPDARYPFIMVKDGRAKLFGNGLADGPFPEHYEPMESPVTNPLSPQQNSPVVYIYPEPFNVFGTSTDYPIVGTTYRVTEHWQAGAMTRNLPWLCELQPGVFVEMSEELAAEKGIANGNQVIVSTIRGQCRAVAMVTKRFKPFSINGSTIHHIGMPWHWGYQGLSTGDSANLLTPHVGDVNTRIPEYKAFLCNIERA